MPTFTGGARLTYRWTPNPEEITQSLFAAADHVRDTLPPLVATRAWFIADIKQRFKEERDPDEQPWAPWSEHYKHKGKILQDDQTLYRAVTNPGAFPINGSSLFIETEAMLTSYGMAHEEGLPLRKTPLPRRSFIHQASGDVGSDVYRGRILTTWQRWINNTVAIYERGGRFFIQRRIPATGRFADTPTRIF